MTGSSNDPRAFCECTRQGNAAAAPAKKGRGMAAFANLGGGGCQCNLTHHHQLIYEPIPHHLDTSIDPSNDFRVLWVHPPGIALAPPLCGPAARNAHMPLPRNNARNPHQPARSCFCFCQ